jgi:hypothetical protein
MRQAVEHLGAGIAQIVQNDHRLAGLSQRDDGVRANKARAASDQNGLCHVPRKLQVLVIIPCGYAVCDLK